MNFYKEMINEYFNKNLKKKMGIGDWGLGIGDWGFGIGSNAQWLIPSL